MKELLSIAFALFAGLMMTRLINKLRLPDVTAYLVAGLLIGPCFLGRLGIPGIGFSSYEELDALGAISDIALGFIAFSIGNEFRLNDLRHTGKKAIIIGVVQALAAALLVDLALIGFHLLRPDVLSMPAAITLGAIATATAPAATLMVVRQYKAKGELTGLLLPIVALDDAVGLVVFAVSFGVARAQQSGAMDLISVLVNPLIEIVASLGLGALAGFVLSGAELELEVFSQLAVVLVGVVYILFRSAGKYVGARASAKAVGCSKRVVDYLGVTLLPQAGVALGMCVVAQQLGGQDGTIVRNIVLFSVLVYELFGPLATKWALTKAGDIKPMPAEVANRRADKLAAAKKKER